MNAAALTSIARKLVAPGKGLLAMDESVSTCNKRFATLGIPQTEAARRSYRQLIVTTAGLGEFVSGTILFDETARQKTTEGVAFIRVLAEAGILFGIKVDVGAKPLAGFTGETVTEGLDGLRGRLSDYAGMGATFAKWRAVIAVGDGLPTTGCIEANAHALARYAALCQEAGLVPIVEPEVLMKGTHTLERCAEVTEEVQNAVFEHLRSQRVSLEGMLLKPNMILPGTDCPRQADPERVAKATLACLMRTVPAAVPGVAFLSGGQTPEAASARLNAINTAAAQRAPWALTFSFGRALQQPALERWNAQPVNVAAAQQLLLERAHCNGLARQGLYDAPSQQLSDPNPMTSADKHLAVVGHDLIRKQTDEHPPLARRTSQNQRLLAGR